MSCGYKRRKRLLLGVHSLFGLFAFSALTRLQYLATRICSHSRNAITRILRGILLGVRKYLDLPGPRGTVFLSQTILDVETKQNAKQFCLVQLEKRHTESWRIYVPLKNQVRNLWRKLHSCCWNILNLNI